MKELKPGDRVRVKQLAVSGTAEACQDGTVTEVKGNAVHVALDVYSRTQAAWYHRQQCVPLRPVRKARKARYWVIENTAGCNETGRLNVWLKDGPGIFKGEQVAVREILPKREKTP
jgi:hypothetical protein